MGRDVFVSFLEYELVIEQVNYFASKKSYCKFEFNDSGDEERSRGQDSASNHSLKRLLHKVNPVIKLA